MPISPRNLRERSNTLLPFYAPLRRLFPEPVDCEKQICPDLVGATVIEHRVPDYKRDQECYRIVKTSNVDACMELNFTTGVCNIYYGWRPDKATRNHERSHCNGWAHTYSRQRQQYEWYPMPEAIASQESPEGSGHRSAASQGYGGRQSSARGQKYPSP